MERTKRNLRMGKTTKAVKDPIEVYCRMRPVTNKSEQICIKPLDSTTIRLVGSNVASNKVIKEIHYKFKRVFDEHTSQKELFDHVAFPLVQGVLHGSNGLLFTYGITSSGKTHTMNGSLQDSGLLPRTLDVIFNSIKKRQTLKFLFKPDKLNGFEVQTIAEAMIDQQKELSIFNKTPRSRRKEKQLIGDANIRNRDLTSVEDVDSHTRYAVFISYVEIYNNYIYDLLDDAPDDCRKPSSKMLREDASHNMYVFSNTETEVKSAQEAVELFYKAQQRRRVSNTALNSESSRAHSVFTIRIIQAHVDDEDEEALPAEVPFVISQLSLVDLAGSERSIRTRNTGRKLRETGSINSSLMALRTCIEVLRETQTQNIAKVVPYRESKLTHLFKTFFEGEGMIKVILCVNPKSEDFEENLHVLKFAEMTQDVLVSRSTPVSTPDISKYRTNNTCQETVRKMLEDSPLYRESSPHILYNIPSEFPQLAIQSSDDISVYTTLIEFLTIRKHKRNALRKDLSIRQEELRTNFIAVDNEISQLQQENRILKMDLESRYTQIKLMEQRLSAKDETFENFQNRINGLERELENTRSQLKEKTQIFNTQYIEVENMKEKMQEKIISEKDRMRKIMETRLAEKQAELERKMCFTDEKFRQLREILNDNWESVGEFQAVSLASETPSSAKEMLGPRSRSAATSIKERIREGKQLSHSDVDSIITKENMPPPAYPQRSMAVANPRHRRSQSSSADVWVEHKPVGNLNLGTVLQPKMKKKRSVSKLEVKDVTGKCISKYALAHQEQDIHGQVETQIFKADVIPSVGGGAQVIFNDVEKLRQVSPPPFYSLRKRSCENVPLSEVEDRCTLSLECHGLPTKMKKK